MKSGMALHPCSAKYAAAIADPFSELALGACVPIGTANTLKCCSRSIGIMAVGTEGVGAVVVYPTAYNNVGGCYLTTTEYAEGSLSLADLVTSKWDWLPAARLPFSSSDYTNVNARVVACGIRLRYVGQLAERAGTIDLLTQPSHNQIGSDNTGTFTQQADLTAFPENFHSAVTNQSYTLTSYAVDDEERTFPKVANTGTFSKGLADAANNCNLYWYPFNSGDVANIGGFKNIPPATMVAYVRGNPGAKFDVEFVVHVEYVGRLATYGASRVEADPMGVTKVCEAANQALVDANADGLSFAAAFGRSLKRSLVENAPGLAVKATNYLLNQLASSVSGNSMSTALMI
jgi:hypothetical protein